MLQKMKMQNSIIENNFAAFGEAFFACAGSSFFASKCCRFSSCNFDDFTPAKNYAMPSLFSSQNHARFSSETAAFLYSETPKLLNSETSKLRYS
jgi:hypothetical protein